MSSENAFYTSIEAAKQMKVSRATFYKLAVKHKVTPVNEPNKHLARPAKLLWLKTDVERMKAEDDAKA